MNEEMQIKNETNQIENSEILNPNNEPKIDKLEDPMLLVDVKTPQQEYGLKRVPDHKS